jgi:hypothetical protein
MAHCSLAVDATDKRGRAIYIQTIRGRVTGWVETKLPTGVGPDQIAVHDRSHFDGDEELERVVVGPLSCFFSATVRCSRSVGLSFLVVIGCIYFRNSGPQMWSIPGDTGCAATLPFQTPILAAPGPARSTPEPHEPHEPHITKTNV